MIFLKVTSHLREAYPLSYPQPKALISRHQFVDGLAAIPLAALPKSIDYLISALQHIEFASSSNQPSAFPPPIPAGDLQSHEALDTLECVDPRRNGDDIVHSVH